MRALCVIPARGGSKGIPGKNLRLVGGASLVGRAVFAAREFARLASLTDAVILVDTDSAEIAAEAKAWGASVPFLRSPEIARDETSTVDSTLGLLERLRLAGETYDALVLLQPTSPLRSAGDVMACWTVFLRDGARRSVTSIAPEDHPSDLALALADDGSVSWIRRSGTGSLRRQDIAPAHRLTGAVYITTPASLQADRAFVVSGHTVGVPLPAERSIDIDRAEDIAAAEGLAAAGVTRAVRFANVAIGRGEKTFIIAEAGVNHNGDPELAHRLIDFALDAGADAVKFQIFDPAALVSDVAPKARYQLATTAPEQSQRQMLDTLTLPLSVFRELEMHARERGILFLATPFDDGSADFLDELGCPALKVSSGEVTNHRFLANLAKKGKPLLLSTGMSTMAEVAAAVSVVRANGDPPLALFHCVTNYPAAAADCNLSAMQSMRAMFGLPVGWSDHTEGIAVTIAAVALGAEIVEKHFTLDRSLPGPDHAASLNPSELRELVGAVREAELARGSGIKAPAASELPNLAVVRRSLHAARDLASGHTLSAADLAALRPGGGVSPAEEGTVVGRPLRRALRAGERLEESDVV